MLTSLRHKISPLSARILAVNSVPLVILVVSILYFSGYQDRLIQNELDSMTKEAHQFAAALGEGAVISSEEDMDVLSLERAKKIAQRLIDTADVMANDETRTRLFDGHGEQIIDTFSLTMRKRAVQRVELLPPGRLLNLRSWWKNVESFWRKRSWSQIYPAYRESPVASAEDYTIVDEALDGEDRTQVWVMQDGTLLLGVAVPVQRYKGVLGAVFMSRDGEKVENAISSVRIDIVNLFLLTLALTILMSLYLARTIAKPLKQLAGAAKGLEAGTVGALKWQQSIPDFGARKDEIAELANALRNMVKALGERMHAIETFAADVAHEIKNPLTSLHSAVETALKVNDITRQQKLMAVIAEDVKRLDRLITDISQASRLEAELNRAKTKPIILKDMLHMVADLYVSHEWDAKKHAQVVLEEMDEATTKLQVRGAETRLAQVFQNLIDNAVSFTPLEGTVKISLKKMGTHALIQVRDEGPGIPENKREAIFDRFYTERPAGEQFGLHSGLGLSIVKQIIEAHKGRVYAENIRDDTGNIKGACFNVELPLSS